MQCLQLTRGDPPAAPLKWYFNQTITLPEKGTEWVIDFVLGDSTTKYHKLQVILVNNVLVLQGEYSASMGGLPVVNTTNLYNNKGWVNSAYRTITFATPPTGDLLAWLKANAVPQ